MHLKIKILFDEKYVLSVLILFKHSCAKFHAINIFISILKICLTFCIFTNVKLFKIQFCLRCNSVSYYLCIKNYQYLRENFMF